MGLAVEWKQVFGSLQASRVAADSQLDEEELVHEGALPKRRRTMSSAVEMPTLKMDAYPDYIVINCTSIGQIDAMGLSALKSVRPPFPILEMLIKEF